VERLKITVNFKHTPEEEELYNELIKYSSPGGYIKDVLLGKIKREILSTETQVNIKKQRMMKSITTTNDEELEINSILDM
jgi:hypothetical protein